jgi:hypothetical protein
MIPASTLSMSALGQLRALGLSVSIYGGPDLTPDRRTNAPIDLLVQQPHIASAARV